MEKRFQCIVHHFGEFFKEFVNFTKSGYKGLKTIWGVDLDYCSYLKKIGKLNELGYPIVDKLGITMK